MADDDQSRVGQHGLAEALDHGQVEGLSGLRRIDTHMSHVFLDAEDVFKLVRPVRHPFADMTSLASRRSACETEFRINKEFAPALYKGVETLVRTPDGRYAIGTAGEIVDYAVRMRRFPDGALFIELADRGRLSGEMIDDAIVVLSDFHLRQPAERRPSASKAYDNVISDLRNTAAQNSPPGDLADLAASVFARLTQLHRKLKPLIDIRRADGFVRRGHGDFHLGNLCLFDGKATPFDALAFDEKLATTDVLYDLGFLLMDLRARGMDPFATLAMNRYFDMLDQGEGALALLPFFIALRGSVRMAVAVESGSFDESFRYARLAKRILDAPAARLVAIGGLSGTGKSVLARGICHLLPGPAGARILATDAIRKREAGIAASETMPARAYSAETRQAVYHALAQRAPIALAAGTSVIADGTYRDADARREIALAAGKHLFCGLWLQADASRRLERVSKRRDDVSDATVKIAAEQEEPRNLEAGWQRIDANGDVTATIGLTARLLSDAGSAE